ncbi:MAG: SDR family oxidoreductase [Chlamydiae bacterium]|nr:SDR family oxidoreductase [Chlamydiota bacterium]
MTKTAFVTGASRGIGKGIALLLASMGYQVALAARNRFLLEKTAEEILALKKLPPLIYPLDVTNETQVKEAIESTYFKNERIDVLVNAAGILLPKTSDLASEDFRSLLEVNVFGSFYCISAVTKHMKKQKSGYIFNIASRAGKIGIGTLGGYCTSKFAVVGLNDALTSELAEFGIKTTAICPGIVDTDMGESARVSKEDRIPVDDVVKTVEFLLKTSPNSLIREVVIECRKTIEFSNIPPFHFAETQR